MYFQYVCVCVCVCTYIYIWDLLEWLTGCGPASPTVAVYQQKAGCVSWSSLCLGMLKK